MAARFDGRTGDARQRGSGHASASTRPGPAAGLSNIAERACFNSDAEPQCQHRHAACLIVGLICLTKREENAELEQEGKNRASMVSHGMRSRLTTTAENTHRTRRTCNCSG